MERECFQIPLETNNHPAHILPCRIAQDGKADTSKFQPCEEADGSWRVVFRGRPLRGQSLDLAKLGYVGVLYDDVSNEGSCEIGEDSDYGYSGDESASAESVAKEQPEYRMMEKFNEVVVWDHSQVLGPDDPWAVKLPELLKLAADVNTV